MLGRMGVIMQSTGMRNWVGLGRTGVSGGDWEGIGGYWRYWEGIVGNWEGLEVILEETGRDWEDLQQQWNGNGGRALG